MRIARRWLLRMAVVAIVLCLIAGTALYVVLGTESGTRWAVARAAQYLPIEIDAEQVSGTLLTRVHIPGFRYLGNAVSLDIVAAEFSIDWSGSNFSHLSVQRLYAESVGLKTIPGDGAADDDEGISMPDLPISLAAAEVRVGSLAVNKLDVTGIDMTGFAASGHAFEFANGGATTLGIAARVSGYSIAVEKDLPMSGSVQWQMVEQQWSGSGQVSGTLAELVVSHELHGEYPATTNGRIFILNRDDPYVDATTEVHGWSYGDWVATDGRVHVAGTVERYEATLAASLVYQQQESIAVEFTTAGDLQGFQGIDALVSSAYGSARAQGDVAWSPTLQMDMHVVANDFDPSYFVASGTGNIDGEFQVSASDIDKFSLDISSVSGTWNGNKSGARGTFSRDGNYWRCNNCQALVGSNKLNVDGELQNRRLSVRVDIEATSLQQLWPGIAGGLTANGRVGGTLSLPTLSGRMVAQDVTFGEWSVGRLAASSRESTPEEVDFSLNFHTLRRADTALGSGRASFVGAPDLFDVDAGWVLGEYSAATNARITLRDMSVGVAVNALRFTEPLSGTWQTDAPFELEMEAGLTRVSPVSLGNKSAKLRLGALQFSGELVEGSGELSEVPIDPVNRYLPEAMRASGIADATFALSRRGTSWSGQAEWSQRQTKIRILSGEDDELVLDLPVFETNITLDNNALLVNSTLHANPGFEATLDASLDELAPDADLQGRFQLRGDNWDWLAALLPNVDNLSGSVTADVAATGPLQSPDLSGSIAWSGGQIAIPALNLQLEAVSVLVAGTAAGDMTVSGSATSGGGPVRVNGRINDILSDSPDFQLRLEGDKALVLNWPDYHLIASPELTFAGNLQAVAVTGKADLDKAEISVRELPEGSVEPSDDVTVAGREDVAKRRTRMTADVALTLGDGIHVQAFGLDTHLEGQLRFIVPEEREPQGEGELRLVKGVFEAYGQRLEIERGIMVFTGPLDDPLIDVRAVRVIDGVDGKVTVGLDLRGRAQNLSSSIYSEPAMAEAEALAYLMLGRPLDQASAADGTSLSNTAFALGLRQAALITNQIGQEVGLDELTVTGNNQNTTALVAGKQINSRLYARYAYGVFTRLGTLLLRYRLSEAFTIEVGAGEAQSMDVLYTIEKD